MKATRTWVPWSLVAGLIVLTAGAALLSVATTSGTRPLAKADATQSAIPPPFTGFAGYNWVGRTTSISAQWTVPKILGGGPRVLASTWVGAAMEPSNAFLQVGITEDSFPSGPPPIYEAFWSDTARHFHPQPIRTVSAGDAIASSMSQTSTAWVLRIHDVTEKWSRTLRIHYQVKSHFNNGEWFQEDPTESLPAAQDEPYPVTTLVQFTDVRVDDLIPTLLYSQARVLSSDEGIYLVPTRFRDDGFAVPPAQGAARQYLADVLPYDQVVDSIRATDSLSDASRQAEITKLDIAQRAVDAEIVQQRWPASADADVIQFVRAIARVLSDDDRLQSSSGLEISKQLARQIEHDDGQGNRVTNALRARLGLPPV